MSADTGALAQALRAIVGDSHVLTDPELRRSYEVDWTGRFGAPAAMVVRPASTEEVSAVLQACGAAGMAVAVQGGNTGLVGAGVPSGGEVLLSLARLTSLEPVDPASGQVTVGAGVRLAALQAHARAAGFEFGVDLAARDSATVGGMIATNAGGIRVLRYGSMRAQVMGLEVVLRRRHRSSATSAGCRRTTPATTSPHCSPAAKARWASSRGPGCASCRPRPPKPLPSLGLQDTQAAIDLLGVLREHVSTDLSAAELFFDEGVELVRANAGLPRPFASATPAYLLVECAARNDPSDRLAEALSEAPQVIDANLATAGDPGGQRALWQYREGHTEAVNAAGVPVKSDIAVPLDQLPGLIEALPGIVEATAPGARMFVWGHLNEGNVHVNIIGALDPAERR